MTDEKRPLYSPSAFVTSEGAVYGWRELRERLTIPMSLPTVVVDVFRAGETNAVSTGRLSGSKDLPLTMKGEKQAKMLARDLLDWYDLAYVSSLQRTQKTLDIALSQGSTSVGEVEKDERLDSRDFGELELGPLDAATTYSGVELGRVPPGGESNLEVARRALSFLLDLQNEVGQMRSAKPVRVLLCTHLSPMRFIIGILRQMTEANEVTTLGPSNCELVREYLPGLQFPRFLEQVQLVVDSDNLQS